MIYNLFASVCVSGRIQFCFMLTLLKQYKFYWKDPTMSKQSKNSRQSPISPGDGYEQENGDYQEEQEIDEHFENIRQSYPSQVNQNLDEDAQSHEENRQADPDKQKGSDKLRSNNQNNSPKIKENEARNVGQSRTSQAEGPQTIRSILANNTAIQSVFQADQTPKQVSAIAGTKITFNGREPSPNRYYHEGQSIGISSRAITPPKTGMAVSFAPSRNVTQIVGNPPPYQYSVNLSSDQHVHNAVRSRIISQVQRAPIATIPGIIVKPQSSIIFREEARYTQPIPSTRSRIIQNPVFAVQQPTSSRIIEGPITIRQPSPTNVHIVPSPPKVIVNNNAHPLAHPPVISASNISSTKNVPSIHTINPPYPSPRIDNLRPLLMPQNSQLPQVRISPPSRTVISIPSSHGLLPGSHQQISRFTQPIPPPPSLNAVQSSVTQSSVNDLSLPLNQSISHTIQILSQYDNIAQQIHSIGLHTGAVSDMISAMLRGETEKNKQQFITNMQAEYQIVLHKLAEMEKEMDAVNQQNAHIRDILALTQSQSFAPPSPTFNRQTSQSIQHPKQPPTLNITQAEAEIIFLKSELKKIKEQHGALKQKYQNLMYHSTFESTVSHEQELQKQIQSQKAIIKKLEQQLITNVQSMQSLQTSIRKQDRQKQKVVDNSSDIATDKAQQDSESKFMAIIESKEAYINQLEAQIIRYKTQIKSLKQQVMKERNEKNVILTGEQEGRMAKQIAKEVRNIQKSMNNDPDTPMIAAKSIQKMNIALKEKDDEMDLLKQKLFEMQDQFDLTIDKKDRKIKQLHEQIMKLKQKQATMSKQEAQEIEALQKLRKQAEQKENEIKKIKEQIQRKKQLEVEVQNLRNERKGLSESLRLKSQEQQKLKNTLASLQNELKNLQKGQQTKLMVETIKKKENEIIKLRQTIDLHLINIGQLQNQVVTLKQDFKNIEVGLVEEKQMNSQRFVEYENKIKEMKDHEIKQHQLEQSEIQKLKHTIKELHKKIKMYEQLTNDRLPSQGRQSEKPDFRQHYSESQIKIFEMENTLKNKDNKIKQLESINETLRLKINHNAGNQQQFFLNQQIDALRKKIADYESGKLKDEKTGYDKFNSMKNRDYQANSLFQQRIIYNLKSQNEKLRAMMSHTNWQDLSYRNTQSNNSHTHKQTKKQSKYESSTVSVIQKRLYEFNTKLEQLITYNHELEHYNPSVSKNHHHSHNKSAQMVSLLQREKIAVVKRYNRQIQALQARIVDLQKYCAELEYSQNLNNYNYNANYTEFSIKSEEKNIYADQIGYYKLKNKELEDRVDSLLALNKELKDKLEQYMRPDGKHNLEYYKQENLQLLRKIADLEANIKLLQDQKIKYAKQIQKVRSDKSSVTKIQSLQSKVQQLSMAALRYQQQKGLLEAQLKKYTQQVIDTSSETLNYKTIAHEQEQQAANLERQAKNSGNKIWELEAQVAKLSNQNEILKAEIQRLQDQYQTKKNESQTQISNLRSQLAQLQQQNREQLSKNSQKDQDRANKDQIIASLNQKLALLESSSKGDSDKITILNQRVKELQYKLNDLQGSLAYITGVNNELESLVQQKNEQILFITKQSVQFRMQNQSNSSQSESLQARIAELELSLRTLKEQADQYRKSNMRLSSQAQDKSHQIDKLTKTITALEIKIRELENRAGDLRPALEYQLESIRSIFVEVETITGQLMIDQQNARQCGLVSTIRLEIGKGLECCAEISSKL